MYMYYVCMRSDVSVMRVCVLGLMCCVLCVVCVCVFAYIRPDACPSPPHGTPEGQLQLLGGWGGAYDA